MTDTAEGLPPLNLGNGSYDYEKTYGAAEKALALPAEERQAHLDQVVLDHDHNKLAAVDPRQTEGYKLKTVTRELADDVKVTEKIQVPSHKIVDDADQSEAEQGASTGTAGQGDKDATKAQASAVPGKKG